MTEFRTRKKDKQIFPIKEGKSYKQNYDGYSEKWKSSSYKEREPYVKEIKKMEFKGTKEQARKEVTSEDLSHWYFGEDTWEDIMQDSDTYDEAVDMWMGFQKVKKIEKHLKRGSKEFRWKEPDEAQAYERKLNMKGYNVYDAYPGGDMYVVVYTKLDLPKADNYGES